MINAHENIEIFRYAKESDEENKIPRIFRKHVHPNVCNFYPYDNQVRSQFLNLPLVLFLNRNFKKTLEFSQKSNCLR